MLQIEPADGVVDVAITAGVGVMFPEPLDPDSVTDATLALERADGWRCPPACRWMARC